ncbi:MAG: TetR/AcrR family transcriptional regulator [Chlorobi bacterium]|nr:TetR/AcrR family transcriptional regulator [Chlorobiota bacterium]
MTERLPRKERERLQHRKDILAAARKVFALRGFKDATIDEIAERAEFGKATLYHYFSTKEEMFQEVIHDGFTQMVELTRKELERQGTTRELLLHFGERFLRHLYENADLFSLYTREMNKVQSRECWHTGFRDSVRKLADVLERNPGLEGNRERVETYAFLFLNIVLGIFHFNFIRHCCDDTDAETLLVFADDGQMNEEIGEAMHILETVFFRGLDKLIAESKDTENQG